MDLTNETVINVAALLKDNVGAWRSYGLTLDEFRLDDTLYARNVRGIVRLTRLSDEIIAGIRVGGSVVLECQRCLREYPQAFLAEFDEEFRESFDVRTGSGIDSERPDDERFSLNENHELDFSEPLRQEILVSLPMRPACGVECPGPDRLESGDADEIDARFAALANLLDESDAD